jgi:hypothetical protein
MESTTTGRSVCVLINNPIINSVTNLTRGLERKIIQASKEFGVGRLSRKEGHDTAFAGYVGAELTETLCDELEMKMSLVCTDPLNYVDVSRH